jgi:hypothetical protein
VLARVPFHARVALHFVDDHELVDEFRGVAAHDGRARDSRGEFMALCGPANVRNGINVPSEMGVAMPDGRIWRVPSELERVKGIEPSSSAWKSDGRLFQSISLDCQ